MCIVDSNGEEPITAQVSLDGLQRHQTQHGKSKAKLGIFIRKSYQSTDLEYIHSILYQVIPVVSHLEVHLPEKPLTPNNIGEALKCPQRQLWKEALFLQYDRDQSNLSAPIPIKFLLDVTKFPHSLIAISIK